MGEKQAALAVDARLGTHPVIQPIADVLQASDAFDSITYSKGQAVVWMLQDYVGFEPFRRGIADYIKAHAYGTAVTDDLWRALDKTSPVPVSAIAHDFTRQAGVPLIGVAPTKSGIRLTQARFATDDTGKAKATWHVPVIEKTLGTQTMWRGVVSNGRPGEIALPAHAIAIVNAGQTGYFRTLYAPPLFAQIVSHFAALDGVDQLGVMDDAEALGLSGYQPLSDFLALSGRVTPGMEPHVITGMANAIGSAASLYRGLPGETAFDAFGQRVLNPVFATVGWQAKAGENPNTALLRSALLDALSRLNDKAVIAEANARFAAYEKNKAALSAELRQNVLAIVARHATPETWDALHALARNAPSALERGQLYTLLGSARDPKLAAKTLALTLGSEAEVTTRPAMIKAVSGDNPEMAFDFAVAHRALVDSWIEPDSRNLFEPDLAANSFDTAMVGKLEAYAAAHIPAADWQGVRQAEGSIAMHARIRKVRLPEADAWLKARGG
jgi:aminopeptidase N